MFLFPPPENQQASISLFIHMLAFWRFHIQFPKTLAIVYPCSVNLNLVWCRQWLFNGLISWSFRFCQFIIFVRWTWDMFWDIRLLFFNSCRRLNHCYNIKIKNLKILNLKGNKQFNIREMRISLTNFFLNESIILNNPACVIVCVHGPTPCWSEFFIFEMRSFSFQR